MSRRKLQEIAPGVLECGKPRKEAHPERPSCKHGPMTSYGTRWTCKEKRREYDRRYYEQNKEKSRERTRRFREKNKEKGLCTTGCGRPIHPNYASLCFFCVIDRQRHDRHRYMRFADERDTKRQQELQRPNRVVARLVPEPELRRVNLRKDK